MRTCLVYGNCHIRAIRDYLLASPSFRSQFRMMTLPPVHECNKETGLDPLLLGQCDVFIYQPVKDSFGPYLATDYILQRLPDSCLRISFGNAYFSAQYPQLMNEDGFPYGDRNVRQLLAAGKSKDEIISLLSDVQFYSYEEVQSFLSASLKELRRREVHIDIPVADFIANHFQDHPLFCTINHPNHFICRYLAGQMLERLGISSHEIATVIFDHFHDQRHPIYPSVRQHLGLKYPPSFTLGGQPATFDQYLSAYIDYLYT